MKKFSFLIAFILLIAISCDDEPIGQQSVDDIAPGQITNINVQNIAGGAIITYEVPKEIDISYVMAEYMVNGEKKTVKASVYSNSLTIEGFGDTSERLVDVYLVDHSQNASNRQSVKINPLTPPIVKIQESLEYKEDFGGIFVQWHNEDKSEIAVTLFKENSKGVLEEISAFYSPAKNGTHSFRGHLNEEANWGVVVKDKWGNISDTIKFSATPIYETKLDKSLHVRKVLPKDYTVDYADWHLSRMFDGNGNEPGYHSSGNTKLPFCFSFDLGVEAKLSRWKINHRWEIPYGHQNMKEYKVFGTSEIKEGQSEEYWTYGTENNFEQDWYEIAHVDTYQPSGGGPSSVTDEDKQYFKNGHEYNVDLEAPKMRYIRVVMLSNWAGGADVHINEMTFYGNDKE